MKNNPRFYKINIDFFTKKVILITTKYKNMQTYKLYSFTTKAAYDEITTDCDDKVINNLHYIEKPDVIQRQDGHFTTKQIFKYLDKKDLGFILELQEKYTLIGLAGPATVGKSYLANNQMPKYNTYSIARRLKNSTKNWILNNFDYKVYKDLVKDKEKIRPFYNKIGKMLRDIDPGYYVKDLEGHHKYNKIIVDDVATDEEVYEIQRMGGVVIWLDRCGEPLIQSTRPCPSLNNCNYFIDLGKK